jgi:phage anti-repressor protein
MNLDIVNLIENNPVSKLTDTYQNKLLEKIKENFTTEEQQLFLASFYSYLNYKSNDFIIDLDTIWEWLGFSRKNKTKELLEKHFIKDIDYKILLHQKVQQNIQGGHNKEQILLTVKTFKKLCMKANTSKANEIHNYYVNLEEILFEVLEEQGTELQQELVSVKSKLEDTTNNVQKEKELATEKLLLKKFDDNISIVYIARVETLQNGEYIIKIGESRRGIVARYNEHKAKYRECVLLDCFQVNRSRDFENYLHDKFKESNVNYLNEKLKKENENNFYLSGYESEKELFLIGKELTYATVINTIQNSIKNFNDQFIELEKLRLENEKLQLLLNPNVDLGKLIQQLTEPYTKIVKHLEKIDNIESSLNELSNKVNGLSMKSTNNFNQPLATVGPRLQKINPETLQIVKVYDSVTECMKENYKYKRPSINKAVVENTIYHGFRWLFVDRELDPNCIHHIEPTKKTRIQNVGYIAKINKDKTKIVNVYIDRKQAAKKNDIKCTDTFVKNEKLINDHYYVLYDDCDDILKDDFTIRNKGKPILYVNGVGQYDCNNCLVNEFVSKVDCCRLCGISDKSVKKSIEKNIMYNGFYYKYIGEKLQCFEE